eukprot:m.2028 g.2028  ORF g.2028 m.2028 type:complete len:750 (+) comp8184_c0_seq1:188-2437(+)
MDKSSLPVSTGVEAKSAAHSSAIQDYQIVVDEQWRNVFRGNLTVSLTANAHEFCNSGLEDFKKLCLRFGLEASVPSGSDHDGKIKVSGSPVALVEFSRQIHSELSNASQSDVADLITPSFDRTSASQGSNSKGLSPNLSREVKASGVGSSGDSLLTETPSATSCLAEEEDRRPFQLNALTVQYVKEVCPEELHQIEARCAVKLKTVESCMQGTMMVSVTSTAAEKGNRENVSKGYDKVRNLFTRISQQVNFTEERMPVPSGKMKMVRDMLDSKLKPSNTKTLIEMNEQTGDVSLIGTQEDVRKTAVQLRKYFKDASLGAAVGGAKEPSRLPILVEKISISREKVDVIVCEANKNLKMDSGQAKEIANEGGKEIAKECREFLQGRPQPNLGSVIVTRGGKLPAKYVFHAVVEGLKGGRSDAPGQSLADICFDCLDKASSVHAKSIAMPALGWRCKNIKNEDCVKTLLDSVDRYWEFMQETSTLQKVVFISKRDEVIKEFKEQIQARRPMSSPSEPEKAAPKKGLGQSGHVSRQSADKSSHGRGNVAAAGKASGATAGESNCPICMCPITDEKQLPCGHAFCKHCIESWFKEKPVCPSCGKTFGKVTGNQPSGKMHHQIHPWSLPGYSKCGTIEITYDIPSGLQTKEHPNPGTPFSGLCRRAYLPDNKEGREVHALLKKAFDARLTFTVGRSRTTGKDNQVTWNDIHHKTSPHGGPQNFGYPDPAYLSRVRDELKAKGIEEISVKEWSVSV